MGGGLMQLVAYGAQDIYLTGNPQITFFKVVYRRHTNFAMESIEQTFNGTADFGRKVTCTVSRNGDLVHRMWLQTTLPELAAPTGDATQKKVGQGWVDRVGHALISNVEVEIGGQRVDKQYGDWMNVWSELSLPSGQKNGYDEMVGNVTATQPVGHASQALKKDAYTLYVPLQFWFCRNPGLALPLIALQYHEVKVNLEFRALSQLGLKQIDATSLDWAPDTGLSGSLSGTSLWVDYIYLDTDERRRFAQVSHEYLIEQVQFTGAESVSSGDNKVRLNFNHPVKELVWNSIVADSETAHEWFNYSKEDATANANSRKRDGYVGQANNTENAKLQLNGHDRFAQRDGDYFSLVQPHQHHSNIPANRGVNVYSFALRPEEHQPSGTCNFSRIDNATLNVKCTTAGKLNVYAVNYNVLRVMSGMGGLAYSN